MLFKLCGCRVYICLSRLCDIGSGSGCVGLAAACLGADVTLTDLPCVFPLLKQNMDENIIKCGISHDRIRMAEYDWGHDTSHLQPPFDIVIVSDCILPKLYPIEPLVQVNLALSVFLSHLFGLPC
jgi:predicted nicotinamide N-methyase